MNRYQLPPDPAPPLADAMAANLLLTVALVVLVVWFGWTAGKVASEPAKYDPIYEAPAQ